MFIAHRGKVTNYLKENTLKAFTYALRDKNYIGVECDIRETKDGYFVLVHDPVHNNKLVKYTDYKDLNLPSLKSLLKIKTNKIILIEIKDIKNIPKLIDLLNKSKRNIYVMSFNKKIINEINNYPRTFKIGILNYVLNSDNSYDSYDFICLLNFTLTDNLKIYFQSHNIEIIIYGLTKKITYDKSLKYVIDNKLINK